MPTSSATRRSLRFLGIAAVTLAVVATTACQQDDSRVSLEATATAYMEAIAKGDAGAANALSDGEFDDVLPADDSLEGAETITDVEIGEIPDDDYFVDIPVSYTLGSERYEDSITIGYDITDEEDDVEPFYVSSGIEYHATANWTGFANMESPWRNYDLLRAGSSMIEEEPGGTYLYPGIYDVTADLGPYAEIVTETAVAVPVEISPGWIEAPLEVEVAPTEQLFTDVSAEFTPVVEKMVSDANEYAGLGQGNWIAVTTGNADSEERDFLDSLGVASIVWSIAEPVTVTWEQDNDYDVMARVVFRATWSNDSGSGVVDVPAWNTSWAYPEGDTLSELNVLSPAWTQGE
jgi:hypothetical protein